MGIESDSTVGLPPGAHDLGFASRLNWLRAGVLGANDGIVSTAGLVIGVAAATTSTDAILTAGLAGLAAGAMSMAVGEYVSVNTQRDSEKALLDKERRQHQDHPEEELAELAGMYRAKGLTPEVAEEVAAQLTAHDALTAHADVELRIDPHGLTNPWHAAWASFIAFTAGALLPLVAILLPPVSWRVPVTVAAVLLALCLTGAVSSRLGRSPVPRAVLRNLVGGGTAMAVTYLIGALIGTQVG